MTPDDVILFFNVIYGACGDVLTWFILKIEGATKKMLQYVKELAGVQLDEVKLTFPISSTQQVSEQLVRIVIHLMIHLFFH